MPQMQVETFITRQYTGSLCGDGCDFLCFLLEKSLDSLGSVSFTVTAKLRNAQLTRISCLKSLNTALSISSANFFSSVFTPTQTLWFLNTYLFLLNATKDKTAPTILSHEAPPSPSTRASLLSWCAGRPIPHVSRHQMVPSQGKRFLFTQIPKLVGENKCQVYAGP